MRITSGISWAAITAVAQLVLLLGCGGAKPNLHLAQGDIVRLQSEAGRMAKDPDSKALLDTSLKLSHRAAAEGENRIEEAIQIMDEARTAALTSMAAATAFRHQGDADSCRHSAANVHRDWMDAVRMLEQTEKVAGRTARGVERKSPALPPARSLPEMLDTPSQAIIDPAEVSSALTRWKAAAERYHVPVAEAEGKVMSALTRAESPELSIPIRNGHLRLAAWAILDLSYRVHAEASRERCRQLWAEALEFTEFRDGALWAMVDLERSMKDNVRHQLEEERARSADREQALYESLKQFEGKFATIRREARGTILSLSDILFAFGKSDLNREAELNLAKMAVILEQFPEMLILVEGHTDNIGSEEVNLKLSERRAVAVHDFLAEQGLAPDRMGTKGYGMSQPVESNTTPEGRSKNRRVDLVIREK